MSKPLHILMMLHIPWTRNLGGSRVQLEIADELQELGHRVTKFDYHDAFPGKTSSIIREIVRPPFFEKAKIFVQAYGHQFDVIDAHQGNLPYSKSQLNFQGLLIARSVGLYAFYEDFARREKQQYSQTSLKVKLYQSLLSMRQQKELKACPPSLQFCDLINVPNQDEKRYVEQVLGYSQKCHVFPFGLSKTRQKALSQNALAAAQRLQNQTVAFVGTWGVRKGSKDWAKIITKIQQVCPNTRFLFLGTGLSQKAVLTDMKDVDCRWIEIVPSYESEALPQLLSGVTVGAFPSYIEGFGFAVLEKLASGIPTVAYDVPGPREMLNLFNSEMMVKAGDVEAFSQKVIDFLQLNLVEYSLLAEDCFKVSQQFSWAKIARDTLEVYQQYLTLKVRK
ncbi:MAG: glycosyltransferase family 4 protein [Jaaginema sp. PMC 1079.18]|nr:glycosyltransferase family 4 protein [Jaaginema sp. PMC 1080.18]MEC4852156.1 glycosyltransferase family 4 protein [Jaaginema sp. PMC 1079.18]MEC4867500.1 glycosyltransferase family 4 protein [Jaaginema sp. PMC 1078.18]